MFVVVVACSSLLCLARGRAPWLRIRCLSFSVGLMFALCLWLLFPVRRCCVLRAQALTKEPQEPWLFGRFGVRFVFVVLPPVRPCCVLRAHALTKEPQEPWLFGRFGVRFVFVVVVACSSLLCLARARAH